MESLSDLLNRYRKMTHPENRMRVGEAVIRAIHPSMVLFVSRRCPPADVDDVVQEILMAVARGLAEQREPEKLWGWCHAIARRNVADLYERMNRKSTPLRLTDEELQRWIEASGQDEGFSAREKDELSLAMEMLNQLTERCRHLLWTRFVEDVPIIELAKTLGEKYDTIRIATKRCLGDARALLNDLFA